jgi:glycosyltransferase involved in cell wall biosynthesis
MNQDKPKISVIVITYNQENLIGRALDSVLCQKEFLYEIVISDDCSKDKTWEVIQRYKMLYPSIIKPYRNEINLGIFGNIESTWNKVTGDIIFLLAGDDTFCDKIFEKTNEIALKNQIDFKKDAFLIFFDFMVKGIKGEERILSNSLINSDNSLSLKIRGLIYNRSMGMSMAVLKKHFSVDKEIGVCAEGFIDIQPHMFSDKAYYSTYVGSVYYSNIGISTSLNKRDHIISYIKYYDALPLMIDSVNKLTSFDAKWIKYQTAKFIFHLTPSFNNFIQYFFGLIKNTEFKYGFGFIKREYKIFVLSLLRRK